MLQLVFSKIKLLYTSSFICKTCKKLCICFVLFLQDALEAQCGIVQHNENLLWNSFLMLFNSLNEQPKVSSRGFTNQHYMLCQCFFLRKTTGFSSGKCLHHYAMPAPPKKIMVSRVVKNIESSRRDGKSNGRFSNFYCPIYACTIILLSYTCWEKMVECTRCQLILTSLGC